MGSFSWLKADTLTKVSNIVEGKSFKFLIPKEYGGGFIKDYYQGYGYLGVKPDGTPRFDMYELLAFWNADTIHRFIGSPIRFLLEYKGSNLPLMKEIDEHTHHNRNLGIDIGTYILDINKLKYPLKLVSASYTGTYEDCDGKSYADPNQGVYALYRKDTTK